ncbi:MAG: mercury(II) reductase [Actinobacteria bacterium]|nr:mercury(II) reductase [Actinomycetota bacterium]
MTKLRMEVAGMTCDSCNLHVARALERAGAREVAADWRKGEAVFAIGEDISVARLAEAVRDSGYGPGKVEALEAESSGAGRVDAAEYDLLIIGAGSAAFAAAIKARDQGARVGMVEHGTVGGTCVNVGCVPSKALLRAGEVYFQAGHHDFAGVETFAGKAHLAALVAQKDELVEAMRQEKYLDLVDAYGFELIAGHAEFVGPGAVSVDGRTITAGAYLVATGASPAVPPIEGLRDAGYLTSTTALDLKELPESMAVIGANAIGLELGQFFLHLGTKVLFFDVLERIAPFEEPEVSEALTGILRDQGAEVHAPARIVKVTTAEGKRIVHAEVDGALREFPVEQVLVATGRTPNTAGMGLEESGVQLDPRGAIAVDEHLRTTNPRVFAAGDCTPAPQFVYVSAYEGNLAAENALNGASRTVDLRALPRVTFTSPQIASAGLTEAQARSEGRDVKTSVLPLSSVPRAIVNRETRGLIKMVAEASTDELLGVSILSEAAGEVIQAAVVSLKFRLTAKEVAETFHPYLTIAEGLKLAAQTFTKDVAMLSCCAA